MVQNDTGLTDLFRNFSAQLEWNYFIVHVLKNWQKTVNWKIVRYTASYLFNKNAQFEENTV